MCQSLPILNNPALSYSFLKQSRFYFHLHLPHQYYHSQFFHNLVNSIIFNIDDSALNLLQQRPAPQHAPILHPRPLLLSHRHLLHTLCYHQHQNRFRPRHLALDLRLHHHSIPPLPIRKPFPRAHLPTSTTRLHGLLSDLCVL